MIKIKYFIIGYVSSALMIILAYFVVSKTKEDVFSPIVAAVAAPIVPVDDVTFEDSQPLEAGVVEFNPEKRFIKPPQWQGDEHSQNAVALESSMINSLEKNEESSEVEQGYGNVSHVSKEKTDHVASSYGKDLNVEKSETESPTRQEQLKNIEK